MNQLRKQGMSTIRFVGTVLLIGMLFCIVASTLTASRAEDNDTYSSAKGRVTYRVYCINCHGSEARGDGSLAELLTTVPTDLTLIAKNNNGTFPTEKVREAIDGSKRVRSHGLEEMPVWGDVFQVSNLQASGSDETGEERANRKIQELVAYLETLQEP
jgi:mono/diheme cytochrome c family protein